MSPKLTFIIGCTACGKGKVGFELAHRAGGEIVSLDSMKVYRRMDVGTGKPSATTRGQIAHHLIDVVEPSEEFSAARYVSLADQAISDLHARGRPIFVVGGTPMYLKALVEGMFDGPGADPVIRARLRAQAERDGDAALYRQLETVDPVAAGRIHPNDTRRTIRALEVFELTGTPISELQAQWDRARTRFDCSIVGLRREKETQSARINDRVRRMISDGLLDEVRSLRAESPPMSESARKALGYAEMIEHLEGRCSLAEAIEMIKIHTRRFAKAQRTWFKRFTKTQWIDLAEDAVVSDVADEVIRRLES